MPPWWDVAWSTLALVVVGVAGTIAAIVTLRTIRRQTIAIETQVREMQNTGKQTDRLIEEATKQSIAAKRSAEALINSERAWVEGKLAEPQKDFLTLDSGSPYNYQLRISNVGRTPAHVIEWEIEIGSVDPAFRELPENLSHKLRKELSLFLPPGESEPLGTHDLPEYFKDWDDILSGNKTGVFRATLKYHDIFSGSGVSREPRETTFVYSYSSLEDDFVRLNRMNVYK
jgi:hypothetical protein